MKKLRPFLSVKDEFLGLYHKSFQTWLLSDEADDYIVDEYEGLNINLKNIAQIYFLRAVELYNQSEYAKVEEYCFKSQEFVKKAYGENAVEFCSSLNELYLI